MREEPEASRINDKAVDKATDSATEKQRTSYAVGKNPNSLANLRKFPPGVSGCPGGRPTRAMTISSQLRDLMDGDPDKVIKSWGDKPTGAQIVAEAMYRKLTSGNPKLIHEAMNRLEGRVPIDTNIGINETTQELVQELVVNRDEGD